MAPKIRILQFSKVRRSKKKEHIQKLAINEKSTIFVQSSRNLMTMITSIQGRRQLVRRTGAGCSFCTFLFSFQVVNNCISQFIYLRFCPFVAMLNFVQRLTQESLQLQLSFNGKLFSGRVLSTHCQKLTGANAPVVPILTMALCIKNLSF